MEGIRENIPLYKVQICGVNFCQRPINMWLLENTSVCVGCMYLHMRRFHTRDYLWSVRNRNKFENGNITSKTYPNFGIHAYTYGCVYGCIETVNYREDKEFLAQEIKFFFEIIDTFTGEDIRFTHTDFTKSPWFSPTEDVPLLYLETRPQPLVKHISGVRRFPPFPCMSH